MAEKSAPTKRLQGPGKNKTPTKSGPSASKAQNFQKDLEKLKEKYGDDYVRLGTKGDPRVLDANEAAVGSLPTDESKMAGPDYFPVRLYPHDKDDNLMELKANVDEGLFGKKELTTKDLEYLQRKKEALNAAQYKQYVAQMFNSQNPAELQMLNQLAPEILQEKMEIIDTEAELDARLAKMRLRGFPRDAEDLKLAFAIKSGNVKLPDGTLWDPSSWRNKESALATINRGLFSPMASAQDVKWDASKQSWDLVVGGGTDTRTGGDKLNPFISPSSRLGGPGSFMSNYK